MATNFVVVTWTTFFWNFAFLSRSTSSLTQYFIENKYQRRLLIKMKNWTQLHSKSLNMRSIDAIIWWLTFSYFLFTFRPIFEQLLDWFGKYLTLILIFRFLNRLTQWFILKKQQRRFLTESEQNKQRKILPYLGTKDWPSNLVFRRLPFPRGSELPQNLIESDSLQIRVDAIGTILFHSSISRPHVLVGNLLPLERF